MSQRPGDPIYLTAAGRRRLEEQVARYAAEVAARRSSQADEPAVDDVGDAAERLIEADDLTTVQDLLAATQDVLVHAIPLPDGPDDGIVRLGSTVTVRDEEGQSRFRVVHPAEFDGGETQVPADSPIGRALLGRARGDQVAIDIPEGQRNLTVLSVEPYRELAE